MPGWHAGSWGYHGDDGKKFNEQGTGNEFGPRYGRGDIVGCGVDMPANSAFFTKNGEYLGMSHRYRHTYIYLSLTSYVNIGIAFENLRGRLVPVVGVGEQEARVRINFGQARFLYQPG